MKRALLLLTILSLAGLARADDQTQAVQQALKDQGFYYGQVDGQPGPETDAAVRRYQIRQGLDVTGKLDAPTLASLNLGPKTGDANNTVEAVPPSSGDDSTTPSTPQDSASPAPSQSVVQSDHDFLRQQPSTPAPAPEDADTPPSQPAEPPPQPAEPPQPLEPPQPQMPGQPPAPDYSGFLRKTPYETAPFVVQRSTVQRAQMRLGREGFYRGIPDGQLDKSFSKALASYQRYAQLKVTGRLDMDTLMDMNLLPQRRVVVRAPAPPPPDYNAPLDGRPVYPGIWVR